MNWRPGILLLLATSIIISLSGCVDQAKSSSSGKLKVMATTTIVGDVVKQVGGDMIDLEVLLSPGEDPHTFSPTPQDIAKISEADLYFINGLGLEKFLETYLNNLGKNVHIVEVSAGIIALDSSDVDEHDNVDPHVWTDPNNVKIWTENIAIALSEYDPVHAEIYRTYEESYQSKLSELNDWILARVAQIPQNQRKIVSDHLSLAYFSQRYGFTQIGTINRGTSTLSEPSAQDLAALEDLIHSEQARAIFVASTSNHELANRISQETGVKIVVIYSGSLSEAGGEAASYIDYMHFNVNAIVEALK